MQPVNTFVITARECSRALTDIRSREQPGLRSHLKGKLDEWHVEYRVTLLRVASWWAIKWVSICRCNLVLGLVDSPLTIVPSQVAVFSLCKPSAHDEAGMATAVSHLHNCVFPDVTCNKFCLVQQSFMSAPRVLMLFVHSAKFLK